MGFFINNNYTPARDKDRIAAEQKASEQRIAEAFKAVHIFIEIREEADAMPPKTKSLRKAGLI